MLVEFSLQRHRFRFSPQAALIGEVYQGASLTVLFKDHHRSWSVEDIIGLKGIVLIARSFPSTQQMGNFESSQSLIVVAQYLSSISLLILGLCWQGYTIYKFYCLITCHWFFRLFSLVNSELHFLCFPRNSNLEFSPLKRSARLITHHVRNNEGEEPAARSKNYRPTSMEYLPPEVFINDLSRLPVQVADFSGCFNYITVNISNQCS